MQRRNRSLGLEIEMVMIAAFWVEARPATRAAGIAKQIFLDSQNLVAISAQDRLLVPLSARPYGDFVAGQFLMAVFASVEIAAALHLDGYDIDRRVVVLASRLRVDADTFCLDVPRAHGLAQTLRCFSSYNLSTRPSVATPRCITLGSRSLQNKLPCNCNRKTAESPSVWQSSVCLLLWK